MFAQLGRIAAIAVCSLLLVAAVLGALPAGSTLNALPDAPTTWAGRTRELVVVAGTFNYGNSTIARTPVLSAVASAAVRSVAVIAGTAFVLTLVSVVLGSLAAMRSHSRFVQLALKIVNAISAMPVLVWSTLIFVISARSMGWILREDAFLARAIVAAIISLTIGDRILGDLTRRVELAVREVAVEPYMRTVRAADLGYRRHMLLSLVKPIGTAIISRSMFLIGGAIVAEQVFEIHGLGFLVVKALNGQEQEPHLILAASLALVAIGLAFRILYTAVLALADPRSRVTV